MEKLFIIANWKSNKNTSESTEWIQKISNIKYQISNISNKEVILCPPFTLLSSLKSLIVNNKLPIKLGAQDISPFDEGAYTGEVNGRQIKELAEYVIIGHSERRENFSEDDETLSRKTAMARKYNLTPIFCVQDNNVFIPQNVKIVAYEPLFAIGSGNSDTPENADNNAKNIREKNNIKFVLYGGSVTSKNIREFTKMPSLNGVLVGGASLDPLEFTEIVKNA